MGPYEPPFFKIDEIIRKNRNRMVLRRRIEETDVGIQTVLQRGGGNFIAITTTNKRIYR